MRIDSAIKRGRRQIDGGRRYGLEYVPAWTEMSDAELAWIGAVSAGFQPVSGVIRLSKYKLIIREDQVDGPPEFRIEDLV